jgi:hypothetical protein
MCERDLFTAALAIGDPAERAAFLEQACDGDASLRGRVEQLLRAHADAGDFLERPAVVEPAGDEASADRTATLGRPEAEGTIGRSTDEDVRACLEVLGPTQRPDSLGRLGHYEVLAMLGRGAFGIVFKAFDENLQRVVAIKVLSPQLAAMSPARKRFLREARAFAAVRHENVVQVYEIQEDPLPYLVMEYVPGETLQQRINRAGPLDVAEVLRLGRQIAAGLAAAHATGLVHRDVKPGNILLDTLESKARLTDFGLARSADDASLTQSGVIAGTPLYMAPEQAAGEHLDHRADLFSLGSVLYLMCTGRPPFRAATSVAVMRRVVEDTPRPIREIIPEVPSWLCDVIAKLLAKVPRDRYQSAAEVAEVLARYLERPPAPSAPTAAPPMRRPILRWLGAATVLAVLAALITTAAVYFTRPGATDKAGAVGVPPPAEWVRGGPACAGHQGAALAAAFDVRGKLLATAGADGKVRVWNVADGSLVKALDFPQGTPSAVTFISADPPLVMAGGAAYILTGWDTDTWAQRFTYENKDAGDWIIRCLVPFEVWCLATGKTNGYHYFDHTGMMVGGRGHSGSQAWSLAVRGDNKRVAVGLSDGNIDFWTEPQNGGGAEQRKSISGHVRAVRALVFSADGGLLVSGSTDKTIRYWNANDGQPAGVSRGHEGPVTGLVLSPDGKYLVSGSTDRTVRLWDTETFVAVGPARLLPAPVNAMVLSSDGHTLAIATADGAVTLWQVTFPE